MSSAADLPPGDLGPGDLTPGDRGLQPERTALAWQRTALAIALATAVVSRLTWSAIGPVAVVVLVVGLLHCAVLFHGSHHRYRVRRGVARQGALPWPAGIHAALLLLQVTLLASMELAALLVSEGLQ